MIDKRVASAAEAVADIFDGAAIMIGGFGEAGSPIELIHALIDQGATNLTMISNNCGSGEVGLAALLKAGRVSKVVCSFPRTANSTVFPELYRSGRTKLELVPQGTLAERIRAGGAGIPAFYTPSAVGTPAARRTAARFASLAATPRRSGSTTTRTAFCSTRPACTTTRGWRLPDRRRVAPLLFKSPNG